MSDENNHLEDWLNILYHSNRFTVSVRFWGIGRYMKHKIPFIYYLIAVIPPLMGAGNFIVAKAAINDIGPMSLLFWRWVVAWIALFPFVIKDFIREKRQIQKHAKIILISALPGIVLFNALMYTAVQYTSSINSSIIANTFPVFVIIISYLVLREPINHLKTFGIILALIGTIFIMTNGDIEKLNGLFDNIGDIIALCGAVAWACYAVVLKFRPKEIKIATFTFTTISIGCLIILPFYLWEAWYIKPMIVNPQVIGAILFVGIPVSVVGLLAWNFSITHIGATTSGLIFYLAPVFNIIMAQIFLGEEFTIAHFTGLCLILLGINLPLLKALRRSRAL